jgi:hypothetical protein
MFKRLLLPVTVAVAISIPLTAIAQKVPSPAPPPPAKDSIYVHMLNIPLALVKGPATTQMQVCKANDPQPVVVDTSVKSRRDTLIVRVMDSDTVASPPEDTQLLVQVTGAEPASQAFTSGLKSLRFVRKPREFSGQVVSVTALATGRPICVGQLARPASGTTAGVPALGQGKPREFEVPRDDEAVVSIGTSFDFLDGARAADLYADLRVFSPSLWKAFGVQAGIYQGRISSNATPTPDSLDKFIFETPVGPVDSAGGQVVRIRSFRRHMSRRQNNLGLYMGINRAIGPNLYWVIAQVEVRKADVRLSIRDTVLTDTTVRIQPARPLRTGTVPVTRVFGATTYTPTVTTGLRLDMHRPGFDVILQPLIGTRLRDCSFDFLPSGQTGTRRACTIEPHFFHWEITYEVEASKSGIKLGGEVRGFMDREPEILVYLAKEFTVEKLAELISTKK